jgi:hypothetical protein
MSALEAINAAKAAGVSLVLDGDGVFLIPTRGPLPHHVVDLIKAVRSDEFIKILEWREAARETYSSTPPPTGCGVVRYATGIKRWTTRDEDGVERLHQKIVMGARQDEWAVALAGLKRFVVEGWGDRACLMGWSKDELYRRPWKWARVDLCGAALLIGERKILAVTGDNIVVQARSGSSLKIRRIGREHIA